jgi:succinate dehydrogenase / fumarate reductase cytochrome b subunit
MSLSLHRENFVLHKIHSLTGVVPIGFYMLQHLTLNSFSIAGPERFNGVIDFFESIPKHLLLGMEVMVLWIPILFHAVYGIFISGRAQNNVFAEKYGWSQNRMFLLQRVTGIVLFLFLAVHVSTTTVAKYISPIGADLIKYDAWHERLTGTAYLWLVFYLAGTLCASYHLAYGIWNFCIRWGITVSEKSQAAVQKFSAVLFVAVTLLAWGSLFGFLRG